MKIDLAHTKDPLIGWNIQVKAVAGKGERISAVRISVNGFDVLDKKVDSPADQWQTELSQKGQFPGENEARVTVTDEKGSETSAVDLWW
jgi:hypothetical protein